MTEPPAPAPHPQALFTELDDGTGVVLHLDTKFYYTLNPTAVFVWKALGGREPRTIAAIAHDLTRAFRVELAEAERDVIRIVGEMLADGLVIERRG